MKRRFLHIVPGSYNEERCHQYAVAFLKKNYPQFVDEFKEVWSKRECVGSYTLSNLIFLAYPTSFLNQLGFKDWIHQEMDSEWINFSENL